MKGARDRALLSAAGASFVIALGACSGIDGTFQGVSFAPVPAAFAVADRHDLVPSGGSYLAVRRSDENMTLDLVLTGAGVVPLDDWRHYPADHLLSLKKELATLDGLHIRDIPLSMVVEGQHVEARLGDDGAAIAGDLEASLVVGLPPDDEVAEQGLGADVNVKVVFDFVDVTRRGGSVAGTVEIKRARAEGQRGEVATGEVTINFSAPLVPERLGKSNLSLLEPVMRCAAALGPVRAGACRDEPPLPYVDASGTLTGP